MGIFPTLQILTMNLRNLSLILGSILLSLTECQRIVNQSYKKSVYFTGAVVREEHMIEVDIADESSLLASNVPEDLATEIHQNWFPNYVFLIPPGQVNKVAGWKANLVSNSDGTDTATLSISEITSEMASCQRYTLI